MEVLSNLESGFASVEAIKNQLFDVVKLPLYPNVEGFEPPNSFGMYKTNGGAPFGTVGKDFTPTQPKLLFDAFEACLYDNDSFNLHELKYKELKGGAKIMFEVPIGTIGFKNLKGQMDESTVKLHIQTGFDGLTKTSLYLSIYRLVCSNGMKAWKTEFESSFKNTVGNVGKAISLCNDVNKAVAQSKDLNELIQRCNKVEVNEAIKQDFLLKTLGYNDSKREELSTKAKNILDDVLTSMELEFSRTGANVWGLVNGITHYTNHTQSQRSDLDSHIFVDGGAKLNEKAQKFALTYI
jgi:hypothetical protein